MSKPFFSIIIPIFNTELYLRRCLDSIVNQSFRDIEVILVNDGSKDNSINICLEYIEKDKRISLILKQNEGLSEARNDGIKKAKGDYILFVDSDDFIDEKACETFYIVIKEYFHLEIIAAKHEVIKKKKRIQRPIVIPDDVVSGVEFLKQQFEAKKYYCNVVRNVYNRKFLIDNYLYFKKGLLAEDMDWTPRVFILARRVKAIDYPFYKNVKRNKSITRSIDKTKFIDDVLYILNEFNFLLNEIDDEELKVLFKNYQVNCFLNTYMMKKGYSSEGVNDLFDKAFLENKALTRYNKFRVFLFSLNKNLYYWIGKVWRIGMDNG